ncbi:thiamine phosphate synthase [Flavobacterium crassostreae]|uniref:Thiamine phosphate synthase n=1 Tax=Flavobacterium crassostreae TaxID=1763534 RepID=A0A1B9E4M3_9FLAO|nr:thiamine phosphate synthase [Flavobacterium crassostreae]OCB76896.1 thiamine phosphate synthase [Flavobacterium crassostreae]
MIVISSPTAIGDEISLIHALFQQGMRTFHLRKPDFSAPQMVHFIENIGLEYSQNLVLHSHHHLAQALGIHRIHFTEKARNSTPKSVLKNYKKSGFHLSTATHSITDFNELDHCFDYAFLSPVFSSISKENYQPKTDAFVELKKRTNYQTKLVALGGIAADKIHYTLQNGFDDLALLGTIWNQNNAIENFKLCQKIVLLF